jgi:hypothetical protein
LRGLPGKKLYLSVSARKLKNEHRKPRNLTFGVRFGLPHGQRLLACVLRCIGLRVVLIGESFKPFPRIGVTRASGETAASLGLLS